MRTFTDWQELLWFWFGEIKETPSYYQQRQKLWFGKDPVFDQQVNERFGHLIPLALKGDLDHLTSTPPGTLSLILILDQFPRQVFRGKDMAFVGDQMAQSWVLKTLGTSFETTLRPVERAFLYLPLEHAEDLALQHLSVKKFKSLIDVVPSPVQPTFHLFYQYALKHLEIIERFGRFPHRNEALGRISSPQEREFLKTPGSSF